MGARFVIRMDHISLKHLVEQRIHTATQQKWLTKLLGYDFEIECKIGVANRVIDALSRKSLEENTDQTPMEETWCCSITIPMASCCRPLKKSTPIVLIWLA